MSAVNRKVKKRLWQVMLVAGVVLELVLIVVAIKSMLEGESSLSGFESIAFMAIGVWIYIAYLKQRNMDISKVVVDEKVKTQALIEGLKDGIIVLNGRNQVLVLNTAAATLTGLSPVEFLGKDITGEFDDKSRDFLRAEGAGEIEGEIKSVGARIRLRKSMLPAGEGEFYRLVCLVDVPKDKGGAVDESGSSFEAAFELSYGNVYSIGLELLGLTAKLKEKNLQKSVAVLALKAMAEALILSGQSLREEALARRLTARLDRKAVNIGEALRELAARLAPAFAALDVRLDLPASAGSFMVKADVKYLRSAMCQVLCNAVLLSKGGATVGVKIAPMGMSVGIAVTGGSIDSIEEQAGGLAGPDSGYFLAKAVVEAHGGTLILEPGSGAGMRVMAMLPSV